MRIERHVFGSRSGYTTLAQSGGISDSERRLLETFAFGQTNDPRYLDSLAQQPAYLSRPLGPKRRAITRVLQGSPDDQGRITLLFPTAVLSTADWLRTLRGDVWPLMGISALWQWDGSEKLDRINVPIDSPGPLAMSPDEARLLLGIVSELECQFESGRSLVLEGTRFQPTVVRAIEMLMPDDIKSEFSSAARSLSANIDVRLNCVARGANIVGAGAMSVMYRPQSQNAMSPYAQALFAGGIMRGTVPWDVIQTYDEFGEKMLADEDMADGFEVAEGLPVRTARARPKQASRKTKMMIALAGFVVVAVTVLGIGLYVKGANQDARDALVAKAESLSEISMDDFLRRGEPEKDSLLADARELEAKISRESGIGNDPLLRLQAWISEQQALRDQLAEKRRMLAGLRNRLRGHRTPDDKRMQLSPARIEKIHEDIKAARQAEGKLTADVMGQTVDLSPKCQGDLDKLEQEIDRLRADLDLRQRKYRVFMQKLQRANRNRDPARAQGLSEQWRKQWQALVEADPAKTKMLAGLHDDLMIVGGRPERLAAARKAIQDVTRQLRVPPKKGKKEDLAVLTQHFKEAVLRAQRFPELIADVEDAQRAMGAAQQRLQPPPKPTPEQARAETRAKQLALMAGVAHHVMGLAKVDPEADANWKKAIAGVRAAVKKFVEADGVLGKKVAQVAERSISAEQALPRPKPPVEKVTYHYVPWDAYTVLIKDLFKAVLPLRRLATEADGEIEGYRQRARAILARYKKGQKPSKEDQAKLGELRKHRMRWEATRRQLEEDIKALHAHNAACNNVKAQYLKQSTR